MLTEASVSAFSHEWLEAWNSHDLERILEHYEEDATLTSPLAAERYGEGTVRGKPALRAYFKLGLELYPELRFELVNMLWGVASIVLYYVNQKGTMTAEVMEISTTGRIERVLANYAPHARLK